MHPGPSDNGDQTARHWLAPHEQRKTNCTHNTTLRHQILDARQYDSDDLAGPRIPDPQEHAVRSKLLVLSSTNPVLTACRVLHACERALWSKPLRGFQIDAKRVVTYVSITSWRPLQLFSPQPLTQPPFRSIRRRSLPALLDATPTPGPYAGYALKSRARITCQTCQKNAANKPTTFVSLAPVYKVCNALSVPWSRASRARALFAELSIPEKDDLVAIDCPIIATNVNTFYCFLFRECSWIFIHPSPLPPPLPPPLPLPLASCRYFWNTILHRAHHITHRRPTSSRV